MVNSAVVWEQPCVSPDNEESVNWQSSQSGKRSSRLRLPSHTVACQSERGLLLQVWKGQTHFRSLRALRKVSRRISVNV